jgi:hypothetical protein
VSDLDGIYRGVMLIPPRHMMTTPLTFETFRRAREAMLRSGVPRKPRMMRLRIVLGEMLIRGMQ